MASALTGTYKKVKGVYPQAFTQGVRVEETPQLFSWTVIVSYIICKNFRKNVIYNFAFEMHNIVSFWAEIFLRRNKIEILRLMCISIVIYWGYSEVTKKLIVRCKLYEILTLSFYFVMIFTMLNDKYERIMYAFSTIYSL